MAAGGVDGIDHRRLPEPLIRQLPEPFARTLATSSGSVLRLAKYPSADGVRVRAFLSKDGRALAMKVWTMTRNLGLRRGMSDQEQRVRREQQVAPAYPVPELIAAGGTAEIDYLVEPVIFGTTPATVEERVPAAVELIGRLATAYAQSGLHERALSTALPSDFMARFEASVTAPWFPWPSAGDRVRVWAMALLS
ncbi:MAG: hypothetical protein WKF45_06420 [Ilumatobacteraceae bacterium]